MLKNTLQRLNKLLVSTLVLVVLSGPLAQAVILNPALIQPSQNLRNVQDLQVNPAVKMIVSENPVQSVYELAANQLSVSNVHLEDKYGQTIYSYDPAAGIARVCYTSNQSANAEVRVTGANYDFVVSPYVYTPYNSSTSGKVCNSWAGKYESGNNVSTGTYTIKVTADTLINGNTSNAYAESTFNVAITYVASNTSVSNVHVENSSGSTVSSFNPKEGSGRICYDLAGSSNALISMQITGPSYNFTQAEPNQVSPGTNICSFNWYGQNGTEFVLAGSYSIKITAANTATTSSTGNVSVNYPYVPPVDTTAPVLSYTTGSYIGNTYDTTPDFQFRSSEAGTVLYNSECQSDNINAVATPLVTVVTFKSLNYGNHSNCSVAVRDSAGNVSQWLQVPPFTVQQQQTGDTTAPVLSNGSSIGTTTSQTPSWSFTTGEAGTITYHGDCASTTTYANQGSNTVVFNNPSLSYGTHSNCYITVRDAAGNESTPLAVTSFTVQQQQTGDTTAPVLSNGSSIGTTTSQTPSWSFTTNEAGTISYYGGCASTTTYAAQGTNTVVFNNPALSNGTYSGCYITVRDAANNVSSALYVPTFTVSQNNNGSAPNITNYSVSRSPFDPDNNEYTYVNYTIDRQADVTVEILNGSTLVKTLVNSGKNSGSYSEYWDGKDRYGSTVSDNTYTYKITASNTYGSPYVTGSVRVYTGNTDNTGDLIRNLDLDNDVFNPDNSERARITWDVLKNSTRLTLEVLDSNNNIIRTLIDNVSYNTSNTNLSTWNGIDKYNQTVSDGNYMIRLKATNGNDYETEYVNVEVDSNGSNNGNSNNDDYDAYYNTNGALIDNVKVRNATFLPNNSETAKLYFDVLKSSTYINVDVIDNATIVKNRTNDYSLNGGTVVRSLKDEVTYNQSTGNMVSWDGRDRYNTRLQDDVYVLRLTAEKSNYTTEYAYAYVELDTDGHLIGFPNLNGNGNGNGSYCAGYWDVPSNSPYCKAIELMNLKGIFTGYSDGSFRPLQPINRAEAVKVIVLALSYSLTGSNGSNLGFRDVATNAWYMPYLRTAKSLGIIHGYPDGTFKPEKTINRVELLKVFLTAAGVNVPYCNASPYSDTPNNSDTRWYVDYVCFASRNGLMYSDGSGKFNPGSPMTRADVADLFYQFENKGYSRNYAYDNYNNLPVYN